MYTLLTPIKILFTVFLISVGLSGCLNKNTNDQTWEMLAVGLPDEISPRVAILNMGYYTLLQTHRPLFDLDVDGHYRSAVLSNWERTGDSSHYRFCADGSIRFNQDHYFDSSYLYDFLQKKLKKFKLQGKISHEGQCVSVSLTQPSFRLLKELSKMENAPSVKTANPKIEDGLGLFRGVTLSDAEIFLQRKERVRNGFNSIRMYAYQGFDDPRLEKRTIQDFNRIYIEEVPGWVKEEYDSFDVPMLQSISLFINHPKSDVRRKIYHCLNLSDFRRAFMPERKEFDDISNLLPIGMRGSKKGAPAQEREFDCSKGEKTKLIFANWKSNNQKQLEMYLEVLSKKTNLEFQIENMSEGEFARRVVGPNPGFDLSVIALDAVTPSYSAFFGPLVGDPITITAFPLPELERLYSTLKRETEDERQMVIVDEMNHIIQQEAIILPLFQEARKFYYPNNLRGLKSGSNFLAYPVVGTIRL
jgi:hypothetical protein